MNCYHVLRYVSKSVIEKKSKVFIILYLFIFRKHHPNYETIALTPRKYWSGSGHGTSGTGWLGDVETNIPALLFPKHVLGNENLLITPP